METVDLTCPNCQDTVACPADTLRTPHIDVATAEFSCTRNPMVTDPISGTRSDDVTQVERAVMAGEGIVENSIQVQPAQAPADTTVAAATIAG